MCCQGHGGADVGRDESDDTSAAAIGSNHVFIESLERNEELMPNYNVLDLASFPPKMSSSASAASIHNHVNG